MARGCQDAAPASVRFGAVDVNALDIFETGALDIFETGDLFMRSGLDRSHRAFCSTIAR